jgi:hypothetical protein
MLKKISVLALAGLISLPAVALAGGGSADLESRINALTKELEALKAQMGQMKPAPAPAPGKNCCTEVNQLKEDYEEAMERLDERAEGWDLASRLQLYGDFRFRGDFVRTDAPAYFPAITFNNDGSYGGVAQGVADALDAGAAFPNLFNLPTLFAMPAWDQNTLLSTMAATLPMMTPDQFIANAQASGVDLTEQQATDLAAIFYNPDVGALLQGMIIASGDTATIGDVAPAFSSPQNLVAFMKNLSPAARAAVFSNMYGAYAPKAETEYDNDTIFTNRFRLNMRAKAMENVEFKARLAMYKAWGMQNNPLTYNLFGPHTLNSLAFDGNMTRQPKDSALYVDRAFMNWNNIGGVPVWFSIGRRPTTDGPPAQIRLGADEKMATPTAVMDYAFDGLSLGYAYQSLFGIQDFPGRIRFCYGRGFEAGLSENDSGLQDVDFGGLSWDVYNKGDRFVTIQSFGAFNMMNIPDNVMFPNPLELAGGAEINNLSDLAKFATGSANGILDRTNLGNIYHTGAVYQDKYQNLNYFLALGWSRTDPRSYDELGTSLLKSWWDEELDSENGYNVYVGGRYDLPDYGLKLGAEFNYGTEYWIGFTPGNDDMYSSKLATRGKVYEVYGIWDIPAGEAISKYAKAYIRLGYQHYDYDYTGSGFWLGAPVKIDDVASDPLAAQFYSPIDDMDQVYVTMEAWF